MFLTVLIDFDIVYDQFMTSLWPFMTKQSFPVFSGFNKTVILVLKRVGDFAKLSKLRIINDKTENNQWQHSWQHSWHHWCRTVTTGAALWPNSDEIYRTMMKFIDFPEISWNSSISLKHWENPDWGLPGPVPRGTTRVRTVTTDPLPRVPPTTAPPPLADPS